MWYRCNVTLSNTNFAVVKHIFNSTTWLYIPGHNRLIFEIPIQMDEKVSPRLHTGKTQVEYFRASLNVGETAFCGKYIETESNQLWEQNKQLAYNKLEQHDRKLTNRPLIFKKATSGSRSFQYMMTKNISFLLSSFIK